MQRIQLIGPQTVCEDSLFEHKVLMLFNEHKLLKARHTPTQRLWSVEFGSTAEL